MRRLFGRSNPAHSEFVGAKLLTIQILGLSSRGYPVLYDSRFPRKDMTQARLGELIVGSYLRIVRGCEIVSYNQRSEESGDQMEMDVLGVKSSNGKQTIYACEVVTHLNGIRYSGKPDTDDWTEFGNETHQNTIEKVWKKFNEDYDLITKTFDDADEYKLELWSPVVPKGNRTEGLEELRQRFEHKHENPQIRPNIIINGEYSDRVEELQERASETEKRYEEPAFRFLQILEHCREDYPVAANDLE